MEDRELILNTLAHLKPNSGYTDVVNGIWKSLDAGKQSQLRDMLLKDQLIRLGDNMWTMQLTAKGMLAKPENFDSNGRYQEPVEEPESLRKRRTRIEAIKQAVQPVLKPIKKIDVSDRIIIVLTIIGLMWELD